jgi:hypothetical protein
LRCAGRDCRGIPYKTTNARSLHDAQSCPKPRSRSLASSASSAHPVRAAIGYRFRSSALQSWLQDVVVCGLSNGGKCSRCLRPQVAPVSSSFIFQEPDSDSERTFSDATWYSYSRPQQISSDSRTGSQVGEEASRRSQASDSRRSSSTHTLPTTYLGASKIPSEETRDRLSDALTSREPSRKPASRSTAFEHLRIIVSGLMPT